MMWARNVWRDDDNIEVGGLHWATGRSRIFDTTEPKEKFAGAGSLSVGVIKTREHKDRSVGSRGLSQPW